MPTTPPPSPVRNPESCTIFLDLSLDNPPKGFGWVITAAGRGAAEEKKKKREKKPAPSALFIQVHHMATLFAAARLPVPAVVRLFTYVCDRWPGRLTAEAPSIVHPDVVCLSYGLLFF